MHDSFEYHYNFTFEDFQDSCCNDSVLNASQMTLANATYQCFNETFCFNLTSDCRFLSCNANQFIYLPLEPLLELYMAQVMLSFLAFTLNLIEILYLICQNRKKVVSEYLLISLAVADTCFALSICIVYILLIVNPKCGISYKHLYFFADQIIQFSINGSLLHVLSMSLERLIVVMFPLKSRTLVTKKNIKYTIITLWFLTFLLQGSVATYQYTHASVKKVTEYIGSSVMLAVGTMLCILYAFIIRRVSKQARFVRRISTCHRYSKKQDRTETVAFITAIVVTAGFVLLTFPLAIGRIMMVEDSKIRISCECLIISNSLFNPMVYFWRGHWLKIQRRKSITNSRKTTTDVTLDDYAAAKNNRSSPLSISRENIFSISRQKDSNMLDPQVMGRYRAYTDKWDGHLKYRYE
ncbi:lysophosphatidic acid receptor 6-like [Hydractinia symbiolongicarpus]|uniref:lysophosphatidic acid receptor 6-like n=1 Tax=Hydractinia symbiolongicarpus TaxID=13093 RepID=UPI00254F6FFB|nr:lysophosphatidic acid receptor 6-like [Hydractinia symbiolongicarpus]